MVEKASHHDLAWVTERIQQFGDRPCLVHQNETYTFTDLHKQIRSYQEMLRDKGVPIGAVVGLHADFQFESIAAFVALANHRAIIAPVIAGLPEIQMQVRWRECNAQWVWRIGNKTSCIEPVPNSSPVHSLIEKIIEEDASGLVLFSSGSVGKPKAMVQNLTCLVETFRKRKPRNLRVLSFLLFDHIGGVNTMLNSLTSGMGLVVPESRNPDVVAWLIESEKVNLLPTSPTFLNLLLMSDAPSRYDLSSLKFVTYGTEPMPVGLLDRLKETFPKSRFLQTFGTSETGIAKTNSQSSASNFLKFEDENLQHKFVDGELWLKSNTQIQGYLNHASQRFTKDGWFKTGDQVEVAQDGYFRIIGRREEIINVGGEKVAPSEVEGVLMQIDAVVDCLVYGKPNAITGSTVVSDIVIENDSNPSDVKRQIRRHCRENLEPFKMPTRIRLVSHTEFSERFKKRRPTVLPQNNLKANVVDPSVDST